MLTAKTVTKFNRFLILAILILVFAKLTLLALKCILAYLHKTVKQHDKEKGLCSLCDYLIFNIIKMENGLNKREKCKEKNQ